MSLKDIWKDLVDEEDYILAEDINEIAHAVIYNENYISENATNIKKKVDKVDGKDLSTNDYTTSEKDKLASIEENANNYKLPIASSSVVGGVLVGRNINIDDSGIISVTVDDELSETSENPVQNKTTTEEFNKIRKNLNDVYMKKESSLLFANALKGTTSGEAIRLHDVSPLEHTMAVKVRSKNLIPYPYTDTTKTNQGITFTDNGDGSITANGTATANAIFYFYRNETQGLQDGVYSLSGNPNSLGTIYIRAYNTANMIGFSPDTGNGSANQIISGKLNEGVSIYYRIETGTTVENLVIKPQLEIGATVTAYTPYADINAVSVKKYGANIFDSKLVINRTSQGLTTKVLEDGGISFKGTATANLRYSTPNGFAEQIILPRGTYTAGENLTVTVKDKTGKTTNKSKTFTLEESYLLYDVIFTGFVVGQSYDIVLYPCISVGSSAEYESYKETITYTPNADGTVEGVTSLYPSTTLLTDAEGVIIDCEYNRDISKAFEELTQAIISLGGNV